MEFMEENRPVITTNYSLGVMEKPGILLDENRMTFSSTLEADKELELKEVPLDNLPEELSYIQRILIVQSDKMASVYVYLEPTRNTEYPVEFVQDGSSLECNTTVSKDFIFEAFPTGDLRSIKLKDMLGFKDYEIDLAQGTFTLLNAK